MNKHLYFVCPTDNLETVINNKFHQENYYLTSLGNSINFRPELINEINSLVEAKNITNITFVLSLNNRIISDALKSQNYNNIKGLKSFYDVITKEKYRSKALWLTSDIQVLIISYYLNLKTRKLKLLLNNWFRDEVKVKAKIYHKKDNTFNEVLNNILSLESFISNISGLCPSCGWLSPL